MSKLLTAVLAAVFAAVTVTPVAFAQDKKTDGKAKSAATKTDGKTKSAAKKTDGKTKSAATKTDGKAKSAETKKTK